MSRLVDMTNQTWFRLTAVRRVPTPDRAMCDQYRMGAWWEFDCACGTKGLVRHGISVRRGLTKSCGCLIRETNRDKNRHRGPMAPRPPNTRLLDQMGKLLARKISNIRTRGNSA